jgi:hypothetical protein
MPSEFIPNNVWGTTPTGPVTEELTLPSGQKCLAKRVGLEEMMEFGLLNEVDSLTAIVSRYTRNVKGGNKKPDGPEIDTRIMGDPEAVKTMFKVADKALPAIVVSPPVALHFKEVTVGKTVVTKALTDIERAELTSKTVGLIFTDQIGMDDKFHLFEWGLGGLDAFARFREGPSGNVGDVADVAKLAKSTKRSPRHN